jgi:nucleotide-binding universal stress UspA family protein
MGFTAPDAPFVTSVLHPSDFSEGSERAFAHALAIALNRHARFKIMHAGGRARWDKYPAVRGTLERWGLLEKDSPRTAVFDRLRLRVEKVEVKTRNPVRAALTFMETHPTDLVVLATHGRTGLPRWIRGSVAEDLARLSRIKTLFVPSGARGIVSVDDGTVRLRRILIPVDHKPDARQALEYARRAARMTNTEPADITLLHVGERMPPVSPPADDLCRWHVETRPGADPVEEIAKAAKEFAADLVVMATDGRDGVLDVFRGSHSERLVRQVECPLLAVPSY